MQVEEQEDRSHPKAGTKAEWKGDLALLAKIVAQHPKTLVHLSEAATKALLAPNVLPSDLRLDFYEAALKTKGIDRIFEREKNKLQGIPLSSLGKRRGTKGGICDNIVDHEPPYSDAEAESRTLRMFITHVFGGIEWGKLTTDTWGVEGIAGEFERNRERLIGIISNNGPTSNLATCANIVSMLCIEFLLYDATSGKLRARLVGQPKENWPWRKPKEIWSDLIRQIGEAEKLESETAGDEHLRDIFKSLDSAKIAIRNAGIKDIDAILKTWSNKGDAREVYESKEWLTAYESSANGNDEALKAGVLKLSSFERYRLLKGCADMFDDLWERQESEKPENQKAFVIGTRMPEDYVWSRPVNVIIDEIIRLEGKEGFFKSLNELISGYPGETYEAGKYLVDKYKNEFVTGKSDEIRFWSIMTNDVKYAGIALGYDDSVFHTICNLTPQQLIENPGWWYVDSMWLAMVLEKIEPGTTSSICRLNHGNSFSEWRPYVKEGERPSAEQLEILERLKSMALNEWRNGALHPTEKSTSSIECAAICSETLLSEGRNTEAEAFIHEFEEHFGKIPEVETRYQNVRRTVESWSAIQRKLAKANEDAEAFIKAKETEILERAAALEKKSEELGQAILRKRVDLEYALNKSAIEELGFDEPNFYEEVKWNVHEYGKNGDSGQTQGSQSRHFDRAESKWQNYVWKPFLRWFGINNRSKLSFVLPTLRASYLGEWKEFLMDAGRRYVRTDTGVEKPDLESVKAVDDRMSRMIKEFDEILSKDQDRNLKSRIFGYLILFFVFETAALLWGIWYIFEKVGVDAVKFESLLSVLIGATIAQITAMIFFIVRGLFGKEQNKTIEITKT